MTKRSTFWLFLVLLFFIILAFFAWKKFYPTASRLHPKKGDVVESIYGLGVVTANNVFHLRTGVPLTVQKLHVLEGDLVKPGQPLIQLDDYTTMSPIGGTVTNVAYKMGELVSPLVSAITVTNLDHLYLEVSLEQQSVMRIKTNQDVVVSFENLRNKKYDGKVRSIFPRDNQFIIRIELKKWPEGILPGMTADIAILVGKKENVLLIPIKTIVAGHVIRWRDGKKKRVPVELGIIDGEWAEVISENLLETDELVSRK